MKEVYMTEMQQKALEFTNSINQTVVSEEDKERYDEFSKWVQAINYLSEDFYVPDENGNLPVLDEISIKAFKDTYKKALEECDKVIKMNSNEGISGKMKDLAKQIKETLMKDSVAFEEIDPEINKNLTLDEIIGLGRSITVDIGDAPIVSESGSFSSRIPIKVADMPGGAVDGYFTPSSDVDTTKNTQNLVNELKEKYPGLHNLIDAITTASHYKLIQTGLTDLSVGRAVRYRATELDDNVFTQNDPVKMKKFATDYYANTLDKVISEDIVKKAKKDPDFIRCMDEMCMKYGKIVKNHAVYVADNQRWLGVPEGSNIDKRNVAMSTMSEMLGKKGLIATAKPMVVVMNGKPVTGTFMTRAFKYNAYDNKTDNPIKDLGPEAYDNPAVFDDIAALQALDYICGNLDRHPGNIMLRFEEVNGKKMLVGITGIDNDMSWGVNNPAKGNQDLIGNFFVRPEQMGALGKKTADYIMGLTLESMKLSLRGYKLDDEALECAWKRTQRLQAAITEGKKHYEDNKVPVGKLDPGFLRVVDEADWNNYHISDLANDNNQFHEILYSKSNWVEQRALNKKANQFDNCDRVARQTLLGIEPLPDVKPIEGKAVGTGIKYTIDKKARMGVNDPDAIKIVVPDNKKPDVVGGSNSKRYMVSYMNSKGEPQNGFFTPSAINDYKNIFSNITNYHINELNKEENRPEWNEVFERTLDHIIQNGGDLKKFKSHNYDFARLGYDKETVESLKADDKFINAYVKYLDDLLIEKTKINLNYTGFGMAQGGTIDKRNVAMSKVSDQLGVVNVIAQSRNAEVLMDGKLVEGVFMDNARGITFTKIKADDPAANLKSAVFDGSMALRDLAELQILDYICLNIDRHNENMLFEFSPDGKQCIGVQGIDNDLSFGTIKLDSNKSKYMDTPLDNINVISERMANEIRSASVVALRNTYSKQGLSDDEINAAINRFVAIKERINSGKIEVIKDEDWKNKKLSELSNNQKNIFTTVKETFDVELADKINNANENAVEEPEKEFTLCEKVDEFDKEILTKIDMEERIRDVGDAFAKSLLDSIEEEKPNKSIPDGKMLDNVYKWTKTIRDSIKGGRSALHGESQFYTDLNTEINSLYEYVNGLKENAKDNFKLTQDNYNEFISKFNSVTTKARDYISHVNDVMGERGRISSTQTKRKGIVTNAIDSLTASVNNIQANYDKVMLELFPEERFYTKMHSVQANIKNPDISNEVFDKNVAELIYLSGISKKIVSLSKENKLSNALNDKNIERNVNEILESDEFKSLKNGKTREEIIELSSKSNAKNLFIEFTKALVNNKKKTVHVEKKQQNNNEVNPGIKL